MFDKLVNSGYFILDFHLRYWIWTWLLFHKLSFYLSWCSVQNKLHNNNVVVFKVQHWTGNKLWQTSLYVIKNINNAVQPPTSVRSTLPNPTLPPVCEVTCIKSICFIICSILKTFYSIFVFVLIDVMCTGLSSKHWTF